MLAYPAKVHAFEMDQKMDNNTISIHNLLVKVDPFISQPLVLKVQTS